MRAAPLAASPDGKLVVAPGDKGVEFWEVSSGKRLTKTLEGAWFPVAFAPDGRTVVTGGRETAVRSWDVKTGEPLRWLPGHEGPLNTLAFSRDSKLLATACRGGPVRIWNAAGGKELCRCAVHPGMGPLVLAADGKFHGLTVDRSRFVGVKALAFAPDGRTLATGGEDQCIRLWETVTGKERFIHGGHRFAVHAAAFLPDGRTVLSAEPQEGLNLWRGLTGEGLGLLTPLPHDSRHVALRPDGRVAALNRGGGKFQLWDVPGRKLLREFEDPRFAAGPAGSFSPSEMALGPDDLLALAGGHYFGVCASPGRPGWTVQEEKGWTCYAVALSGDGKKLAAASYLNPVGDKRDYRFRVRLWESATGKRIPAWARRQGPRRLHALGVCDRHPPTPHGELCRRAHRPRRGRHRPERQGGA